MTQLLLAAIALINAMGLWILTDFKTDLRALVVRVNQHESWLAALRSDAVLKEK